MCTTDDDVVPVSEHTQETEGRLQKARLQQNGSDFSKMCSLALTSVRDNSSCSVSHTHTSGRRCCFHTDRRRCVFVDQVNSSALKLDDQQLHSASTSELVTCVELLGNLLNSSRPWFHLFRSELPVNNTLLVYTLEHLLDESSRFFFSYFSVVDIWLCLTYFKCWCYYISVGDIHKASLCEW